MSFSGYSGTVAITVSDNPSASAPNSALPFGAINNATNIPLKSNYVLGGNAIKAVNAVATSVLTIAANGSATLNLQAITDMLGETGVILVRLKRYIFWLLSPNDDATAGTACTQVTVGNAGTDPHPLNMGAATSTQILQGNANDSGDKILYASTTAPGITVSGTACNVLFSNNDSSHSAAVYYDVAGATS